MSDEPLSKSSEQQVAAEAARIMGPDAFDREGAARLIYRRLGRRIMSHFVRHRVPEAEAEELMADVVFKFIGSGVNGSHESSAIALLWAIVGNVLIDWSRRRVAQRRGGQTEGGYMEVSLDDEAWESLLDTTHSGLDLPHWIKSCVHRAAAFFQHEKPQQADLLLRHAQGYSSRELAAMVFGIDVGSVSLQQENAAKSRIHHACKLAREYFQECKE